MKIINETSDRAYIGKRRYTVENSAGERYYINWNDFACGYTVTQGSWALFTHKTLSACFRYCEAYN